MYDKKQAWEKFINKDYFMKEHFNIFGIFYHFFGDFPAFYTRPRSFLSQMLKFWCRFSCSKKFLMYSHLEILKKVLNISFFCKITVKSPEKLENAEKLAKTTENFKVLLHKVFFVSNFLLCLIFITNWIN